MTLHSVRFCAGLMWFYSIFALMHFCTKFFHLLGYLCGATQYSLLCEDPVCHQKSFCTFLSPKTYALQVRSKRTKSEIRTTICIVKHRIKSKSMKSFEQKYKGAKTYKTLQKPTKLKKCKLCKRHVEKMFSLHV